MTVQAGLCQTCLETTFLFSYYAANDAAYDAAHIYEPPHGKTNNLHRQKTKAQISFAVTVKLISAFVFTTPIVQFLLYLQNFKPLAIFCDCTVRFVSDLFGNHIVGFPTIRLISRYHMSPLMCAARGGNTTVIERLVQAGANLDKQDSRGYTVGIAWFVCFYC